VRLAARARSFHRHGSTTQTLLDEDERQFLFERNALLMVVKNVGDANLASFLAYALFLLTARASSEGTSSPALRAFDDVVGRFDELTRERARVQALRRRDDAEILSGFGRPFFTASGDQHTLAAAALLRRLLGLHELVGGSDGADPTAEIRQLLEQHGVGRSPWWHLRRSLRSLVRGR
jgi:hypothetical protein